MTFLSACLWLAVSLVFTQSPAPAEPGERPLAAQPAEDNPAKPEPGAEKPVAEAPTDPKAEPVKPAEAQEPSPDQLLRYKLTQGGIRRLRVATTYKQTQRIGEKTRVLTVDREDLTTWTVVEIDEKGFALVKVRIDGLRVTASIDGQAYQFDSQSRERPRTTSIAKSLTPLYERLTGAEYQMLVGPQGEVAEVRGYADLLRDVLMNNPLALQLAGGGFNHSAQVAAEEQTVIFGNQVVKPGEKWAVPVDLESPSAGRARGKRIYTLVGPEKSAERDVLRIHVATDLVYDVLIERDGHRVSGTLTTVESTGAALFDKAAGSLVSLKASWKLSGPLTAVVNGMPTEIAIEQSQSLVVEERPAPSK